MKPSRNRMWRRWTGTCLALTVMTLRADEYRERVWPLLEEYCLDCHDAEAGRPKGDFDLLRLRTVEEAMRHPDALRRIRNALHFQEMPPPDKKHQPEFEERRAVIDWINRKALRGITHRGVRDSGAPVLRRLTRLEYNNTLRDLLGLDGDLFAFPERLMARRDYFRPDTGVMGDQLDIFIPEYGSKQPVLLRAENVPGDNRAANGFFNQGDRLGLSPMLMERYLAIATKVVRHPDFQERASRVGPLFGRVPSRQTPVPVEELDVRTEAGRVLAPLQNIRADAPETAVPAWLFADHVTSAFLEGRGGVFQGAKGRLKKGADLGVRFGSGGEKTLAMRSDEDLWFVDFQTAHETSPPVNIANAVKGRKRMHFDFKVQGGADDEGVAGLGVVVLSRAKGAAGSVTLTAHLAGGGAVSLSDDIATGAGEDNTFFSFNAPEGDAIVGLTFDGSGFSGDYALLDDLAFITGRSPLLKGQGGVEPVKPLPPPSAVTGAERPPLERRDAFAAFLGRAFRGGVTGAEVDRYYGVFEREMAAGTGAEVAMQEALRAVLSAPRLLLRMESSGGEEPVRRLDGMEIANRLSYFLWATMPDEELFLAARDGRLERDEGVAEAVRRMLKDRRVKELSDSFAYQWLQLNKLIGAQPDRRRYPAFYGGPQGKSTMAAPLLQESLLLFETVLVENRPVIELIDPGFSWLNPRLIDFYGLGDHFPAEIKASLTVDKRGKERKDDDKWFRCRLPDRRRGGVLCQGSVHALTSLPLRTSPVYRGVWVAEVILNRPPPPPPAAVEELGDDDRGLADLGLTLRKKLEQHRNRSACLGCHRRIDPLGFALENFDGVGRWRDDYDGLAVDASGRLWNGGEYDGIVGFKDALRSLEGDFVRGFVRHLLTYALGRQLEAADEQAVDEIVRRSAGEGHRLQDLVIAVSTSYPFLHARNETAARTASPTVGAGRGEADPDRQRALAGKLGSKVQRFEEWLDDDGNVTGLIFINHPSLDRTVGPKPGVSDADLLQLTQFPKLTALNLEAQPVTDRGLEVLKRLPRLKQVGFHYMAKHPLAAAGPGFIEGIDGMRDLEILEIKHNFRQDAIAVERLTGPFPKVWRLVLDTPLTADQTMHLVRLCPNVTDLQLHRSRLSAGQLREVGRLLPKLEVLWWKPKGSLLPEHLAALAGFKQLRIFSPQQFKNTLPFENGWSHLLTLPRLQRLEVSPARLGEAADRLRAARSGLVIDPELTRSRNYNGL